MSVLGHFLTFIEASGWQKVRSCVGSVLGCGSVLLVGSCVLSFLWVMSEENWWKMVAQSRHRRPDPVLWDWKGKEPPSWRLLVA